MNTLRQAVREYLELRRSLGFTLLEAGKGLIDFVTFLERHKASYITRALALAYAGPIMAATGVLLPLLVVGCLLATPVPAWASS